MKKNMPLLVFGLFILIALAFVLCTLTVWAFMSNQGKTLRLVGSILFMQCINYRFNNFDYALDFTTEKKAKIKRLRFSGALSFIISNDAAIL